MAKATPIHVPERLITIKEGMAMLSQSRENFYRCERTIPDFPKRVYPNGPGSKAKLVLSEVEAYIARRIKERDRPDNRRPRRIGRPVKPPEQQADEEKKRVPEPPSPDAPPEDTYQHQ